MRVSLATLDRGGVRIVRGRMRASWLFAIAACADFAGGLPQWLPQLLPQGLAHGQVTLDPSENLARGVDASAPGREAWLEHPASRVHSEKRWLVDVRFRVVSRPPTLELSPLCCDTDSIERLLRNPNDLPSDVMSPRPGTENRSIFVDSARLYQVRHQWLTLPLVTHGALQRADASSARAELRVDQRLPEVPTRLIGASPSMQQELGWRLIAGHGPAPHTLPSPLEWRVAEVKLRFHAALRDVRFDRKRLADIPWPNGLRPLRDFTSPQRLAELWPTSVRGAFLPQAYIDFAPAASGLVKPIDAARKRAMASEVVSLSRLNPQNPPPPSELAYELARAVFKTLRPRGDSADVAGSGSSRVRQTQYVFPTGTPDPGPPPARPRRDPDTFEGFSTRDVLSVWSDRRGNNAERAAVLASVLRDHGIPARVMLGVVLDEPNARELFTPRQGWERRETREVLPESPATGPDDPTSPNLPMKPERVQVRGTVTARTATLAAWVEFALVDRREGQQVVLWVPIDPGTGGDDWSFGRLRNAQHTVALATNFWPQSLQFVGRTNESLVQFGKDMAPWNPIKAGWHLPAGMFGMQSAPPVVTACQSEWRVTGRKASVREMDEFLSVRRVVAEQAPSEGPKPAEPEPSSSRPMQVPVIPAPRGVK